MECDRLMESRLLYKHGSAAEIQMHECWSLLKKDKQMERDSIYSY